MDTLQSILRFVVLLFAGTVLAQSPPSPSAPLISNGPYVVTVQDFEAQMLRIPEHMRAEARGNMERVASMTDSLFVNRVLAEQASRVGAVDDPLTRKREQQVVEGFRARAYLDHVMRTAKLPELEARAKELYVAERDRHKIPDRYEIEHILVNLWGRTREMALERAREARSRIQAGAQFLDVAKDYSDDPTFKRNGGKLGLVSAGQFEADLAKVVPTLKIGEVSEPIPSRSGVHLFKVTAKVPGRQLSFDDVKDEIIERERTKLLKKLEEDTIEHWRKHPETKVNAEALKSLIVELPRDPADRKPAAPRAAR
jgi:hypothetical protein